jgi:Protein of unknown function (DUF3168)
MINDIRPALRTFLLADAPIAAVVATRVFPVVLPQGERGASIVCTRVSGMGDHTTLGPSGLARPRMQIDAWAATPDEAAALANLVKDRVDGYRGLMGTVPVQGVFFADEREDYQSDIDMHRMSRDYIIWYEER